MIFPIRVGMNQHIQMKYQIQFGKVFVLVLQNVLSTQSDTAPTLAPTAQALAPTATQIAELPPPALNVPATFTPPPTSEPSDTPEQAAPNPTNTPAPTNTLPPATQTQLHP